MAPVFLYVWPPLDYYPLLQSHNHELTVKRNKVNVSTLKFLNVLKIYLNLQQCDLTQHSASCICSSARRRPMHILLPMPKGIWANGLMEFLFSSHRSGMNCFPLSKYSSLDPSAWLLIIRTVCN